MAILESDLVNKPERERFCPHVSEVGEGVEECHVGPADKGVADPGKESHHGHKHDVEGDPMDDKEAGQHGVVITWKTAIVKFYHWCHVNLRQT